MRGRSYPTVLNHGHNIVASGVKVMVLAVIVGIGSGLFSQFATSYGDAQPTVSQALSAVLAALALLGLGIFGPGIATGLITGAPQLGAGAAVGTGLAAGGVALAGAGAAGIAVRGAGAAISGTAAAARAGAGLAGGAASAYSAGAAGQSGMSGVAGGLGGVARAGAAAATSPLQRSADTSGEAAASSSGPAPSSNPASSGDAPDWARRMRRSQQVAHGIQTATHAVRSGDSHGGGSSISLSESDRP